MSFDDMEELLKKGIGTRNLLAQLPSGPQTQHYIGHMLEYLLPRSVESLNSDTPQGQRSSMSDECPYNL